MICSLCPRNCGKERREREGDGFCRAGMLPKIAKAALHHWEEPCISGKRGSGTVFFSGCNLGCVFCQNYKLSHEDYGEIVSIRRLAEIFSELEEQGAHNINLVTPTHYVPAICEALALARPSIPVVYNCGGYEKTETLELLRGYIDIYLTDIKYYSNARALRYSGAPDYFAVASKALLAMREQTGPAIFDEEGILQKGTVLRHLVLPGCGKDSQKILRWFSRYAPKGTYISLMSQYIPCGKAADYPEINRRLRCREYEEVVSFLMETGIEEGWLQDLDSAKKEYIPDFDLQGVFSQEKY
ncbi:radical SAM protein [Christensenellaceae bacterium NSJ-63]|uniref:Radical SAM protein n=1 Tax=Guopingia tenuis TaxID=2763656 RepID=A0A926DGT6_9FIRM|nr:radical SAM protein [Guopingia tenuis]MBC8537532.1 radical SAM protein [Guopingia tenuis]